MCNSDDSALTELTPDGLLNEVISFQIHSSCGLIKDKDLSLTQESPGQTHQLTLSYAILYKKEVVMLVLCIACCHWYSYVRLAY